MNAKPTNTSLRVCQDKRSECDGPAAVVTGSGCAGAIQRQDAAVRWAVRRPVPSVHVETVARATAGAVLRFQTTPRAVSINSASAVSKTGKGQDVIAHKGSCGCV